MAEMTASEAIAVLHNNQYQKHIGNGEYDYIHPLTDAECKGIESLIQQQQQTIEAQAKRIEAAEQVCEELIRSNIKISAVDKLLNKNLYKALTAWQQVKEGQ